VETRKSFTMKKLAITMGDPGGIGPEIVIRAIASEDIRGLCSAVVIGDRCVMEEAMRLVDLPLRLKIIANPGKSDPSTDVIELMDICALREFEKGRPTAEGGRACAAYIKTAVKLALDGKVDGIVTAPISKEALKIAGMKWPGHTEMLAELTGTADCAMVIAGGPLRVILVTIHTALKNVPALVTKEKVLRTVRLAARACRMLGLEKSRIGVAGLNPHAGEAGIFGDEEVRAISPAVEEARRSGIPVSGPFPPDTIFHRAYRGDFDMVVCMYHDQGLIPLKMIAFDKGVNITVGLPFIRTSPDHGTAYDIAWQGVANPSSMIEAIRLASGMSV
jgi:4-hydroxythreonine-4-phosphate dehydrogenase